MDHIDSDRTNNSAENLRWVSRKQNNSTGHSRRMKSKNAKHSDRRNQVIRMEKDGVSKLAANGYVAAEMIGCSHVLVYNVLNPSHWAKSAKGWRLEWVDLDAPE